MQETLEQSLALLSELDADLSKLLDAREKRAKQVREAIAAVCTLQNVGRLRVGGYLVELRTYDVTIERLQSIDPLLPVEVVQ